MAQIIFIMCYDIYILLIIILFSLFMYSFYYLSEMACTGNGAGYFFMQKYNVYRAKLTIYTMIKTLYLHKKGELYV